MSEPVYTLRALLSGLIDYAGLFPPARLEMRPAVEEYARQRQSPEAWMLGRFIVPVTRLDEFEAATVDLLPSNSAEPWTLSVLAGSAPESDRERIDLFNRVHQNQARIEAVELKAPTPEAIDRLAPIFQGLETYFEIPPDQDPRLYTTALRRVAGRGKIRTGGVTPDLIPSTDQVARFIGILGGEQIPFKATAGLHHPLRGEYPLTYEPDSVDGTMFGFLNVFLAAAFAQQGLLEEKDLRDLLEERSAAAFDFDEEEARWREHRVDVAALALARKLVARSYGSCSFAEPVADLKTLKML